MKDMKEEKKIDARQTDKPRKKKRNSQCVCVSLFIDGSLTTISV